MSDHVMLGEVETHYDRTGTGDPLVLLHPGGVDSRVFATLVPDLAEDFEVFRPTGAGTAAPPTSLLVTRFVTLIARVG